MFPPCVHKAYMRQVFDTFIWEFVAHACSSQMLRLWLEAILTRVISVVKLLKGIWGKWLLPSERCGWVAAALSCWRGAVSNVTCLNPQMPTVTASCDEIQFTGEMVNSVWVVGVLSFLLWSRCFRVCSVSWALYVCLAFFMGCVLTRSQKCWDWKMVCFSKFLKWTQKLVPSGWWGHISTKIEAAPSDLLTL